jgi:ubiquitin carboxyl-terminal hydrolase 8
MSPVLSHGPTRPRSTSASVEGPISTENDTRAGIMETLRGTHRIFPHIDDLMGTRPIVDVNWHIKRLINEGESFAKQVDTQLDFRRLDIALQEHIKATVVATEIIPRHRDYPSLQAERGVLYRAYSGLMKRITAQNSKIDAVIGLIKEQNAKSGVQPTTGEEASKEFSRPPIDGNDGSMFMRSPNGATSSITSNGHQDGEIPNDTPVSTSSFTNGNAVRKKPAVQPKPNGLHGNALKRAGENISPQIDLVARFARLRSPDPPSPVQDPRIRTQPISFPPSHNGLSTATPKSSTIIRPSGPREMPSAPTSPLRPYTVSLDVHLQGMPRPPDAIYSPDRNTDSLATVNLPTSIPRNSSYLGNGNKVSAPPISTVGPTPSATDSRKDYFSASDDTSGPGHSPTAPKRQALEIPDGTTVTAEELLKYIQMGSQTLRILVVDLRSREEFDSGHIMAQSIICVEPIALRDGMSAEELGESIVVSPENEQRLYEQRHQFDLITFYDQSSSSINSTKQSSNNYLLNFSKAVFEYGYSKQAKRRPRILLGGLDAWIDLMSTGSLQTSSTAPSSSTALLRSAPKFSRPFGRVSVARDARKVSARARKPVDSRLSKEEEKQWAQTLREDPREKNSDDENPYLDEFSYVKTTEDFLRKYPELPSIQESMISTRSALSTKNYHDEAFNSLPMPPTRPAPALPRQRSSGISEKGPTPFAMSAGNGPGTISRALHAPGLTGLDSTGVHCYVNAALQCLSATPPFRDYLLNTYEYNANFLPPRKAKEDSKPPQLLTRNLQKVIRYLWTSHYEFISPRTFWVRGCVDSVAYVLIFGRVTFFLFMQRHCHRWLIGILHFAALHYSMILKSFSSTLSMYYRMN